MPVSEQEQTVTEDALTASLDALLKAADAKSTVDELSKGGQVYSGRIDEDGKGGGGGAGYKDAGGLENMMIGKMVAEGMSGQAARAAVGSMMGFLAEAGLLGKANKEDEGSEEDEEEDEEEMSAYARGYYTAMQEMKGKMGKSEDSDDDDDDRLSKSFKDEFTEDSDIADGINATPFMEAMTVKTTQALDGLRKSQVKSQKKQDGVNIALARAVHQLGTMVKSQDAVIKALGNRLGVVETQPVSQPKGAVTTPAAAALAKSMPGENGRGGEESLTKSEMASALSYLRFEKGMNDIAGAPLGQLAVFAESGGDISKSVRDYMTKWLATHPQEREAALSYH